ncbi:MAG: 2,3,4,5-tetrahydropyridine-2,6-dicarboxylate N-succinyltransferase [Bdellovibrionales bacterium RIFOXYD12_FULL_39_22]|nr:MAG: 2,3,4,5-tetrahydropyridine-2,6-dicarboxylate N-succinyltransferase [Bdellovibrionales bacterium RIFOXYB1_FULL_39_21]OFZ41149.1 MAG: 2,3,4,5-tetrahydropyridine-2,6-dicarboxylate N-succinyltransferase [Bdellovibrionales bacterium RIFOXYC12_FULL_39_17]OFZ44903.1 MAG: 2,3,4,5-tetrahydropyridine-2,6-dicarboxylate N-succinyltransferase [Bdellovibrionales bacterium RIFOXYC1_FULL_39_130]OFZ74350.1 MAG: 2,3,4,5-tetrahydropyridine-2,6-dicarboxylate N-succinyltransferase [Bdellovibrionales bacteriu
MNTPNLDKSFEEVLNQLESGQLRSAYFNESTKSWLSNSKIKESILAAFRAGVLIEHNGFIDKDTLLPQTFSVARGVRIVPGGSAVRRGSYVATGVIIMPPSYINVGAYIDSGTMIDSNVLVGSCAQIGKNVHLSAGVQIGGVLEPIGQRPVIIEDNVFVGAGSIIVEGVVVKQSAVIAPGVILSKGVTVYDTVHQRILERGAEIPPCAVVIPGSRPLGDTHSWGEKMGLHTNCALIIKYRDEKSNASLELEQLLR